MLDYGEFLLLGFFAAAISYGCNTIMVKLLGNWYLITIGPVLEEGIKSTAAWYFGAPLLFVHMTFGFVEGFYEFFKEKSGRQSAILSLMGHSIFGWITNLVFSQTNRIELGILAGVVSHAGYNLWIFFYFTNKRPRRP